MESVSKAKVYAIPSPFRGRWLQAGWYTSHVALAATIVDNLHRQAGEHRKVVKIHRCPATVSGARWGRAVTAFVGRSRNPPGHRPSRKPGDGFLAGWV